jgi:hypothetical protein
MVRIRIALEFVAGKECFAGASSIRTDPERFLSPRRWMDTEQEAHQLPHMLSQFDVDSTIGEAQPEKLICSPLMEFAYRLLPVFIVFDSRSGQISCKV